MDETGCRIGEMNAVVRDDARSRTGIGRVVEVFCGGTPGVLASRLCPVCLKVPIHAGQEVCSGRCRAARSRQRKAEARRRRDAEIRALLEAALEKLREDP
jgi:predicted nucleic acid-binding Zn ribbon protein